VPGFFNTKIFCIFYIDKCKVYFTILLEDNLKTFKIVCRVRDFRKQKRLTQQDLADTLGISRQSLFALEAGKSEPSLSLAFKLAKNFGALVEEIFNIQNDIGREVSNMAKDNNGRFLRPFGWGRFPISDFFEEMIPDRMEYMGVKMPPVDIYQDANEVIVKAQIPGLKRDQLEISVDDDSITLKGEKKEEHEEKGKEYYRKEISAGSFQRTTPLPAKVMPQKAQASFEDGILTIKLPKSAKGKTKTVKVKIK